MSRKGKVMSMILGIVVVIIVVLGFQYAAARKAGMERFTSYRERAKEIMTAYGKLSFIDEGSGESIISCHGICGGYDQAYDTLADKTDLYRVLAPSRFGYPGSDIPENPTVDKQTEAFAEMLDELQIEKTFILGTSAGGTSAIKFALNHPERTKGLILYCSGYPGMEPPDKEFSYVGPPAFLCHDLPMWLFSPLFPVTMGMEQDTIKMIMPFEEKHDGIVLDAKLTNTDMVNHYQNYDMSKLQVPVLILHAKNDKLAAYEMVEQWAAKIPDCTFVPFESGGHLMKGNEEKINASLEAFIEAHR